MGRCLTILVASLIGVCQVSCKPSPPPVNILVLSVDTLRADRLGVYGNDVWGDSPSPHIDALASHGTTFDRSYAPRGQTRPSVAAFLTGKYPITTGVRENGTFLRERHLTFIQRLADAGHQTGVFLSNFRTDSMGSGWAYRGAEVRRQGHDPGDPEADSRRQVLWDDRVEQATVDFLDSVDRDRPFTAYVHFFDVHKPFNPPEGYDRYGIVDDLPAALRPGTTGETIHERIDEITRTDRPFGEGEHRRILGLYDGTVTATDDRIGRILAKLEQIGERDDTVIVLTSDHGEELFDRNRYAYHGNSIYEGVLRVPLIIAGPGLAAGVRRDVPVMNIDVTATILDLAGLSQPADIEGRSLASVLRGESVDPVREHLFFEWQNEIYAVSDGDHAYVFNPDHTEPMKSPFLELQDRDYLARLDYTPTRTAYAIDCYEGYDLPADPLQASNLLGDLPAGAGGDPQRLPAPFGDLRRALAAWLNDPAHEKTMSWPGLDQQADAIHRELEQLRSLGYVGIAPQAVGGPQDRRYLNDCGGS